jgi:hypothetical protein
VSGPRFRLPAHASLAHGASPRNMTRGSSREEPGAGTPPSGIGEGNSKMAEATRPSPLVGGPRQRAVIRISPKAYQSKSVARGQTHRAARHVLFVVPRGASAVSSVAQPYPRVQRLLAEGSDGALGKLAAGS